MDGQGVTTVTREHLLTRLELHSNSLLFSRGGATRKKCGHVFGRQYLELMWQRFLGGQHLKLMWDNFYSF